MISHYPAKMFYHKQCGNGDTMVLVCNVILQDHPIKASCDFMGKSPSITILESFVVIDTVVVEK